jgi:prevent-host-death family protein
MLQTATIGYNCRMTSIPVRELRNNTAAVIKRVTDGNDVTITVNGRPVAELVPVQSTVKSSISKAELVRVLRVQQADAALAHDLAALGGGTTYDLGDIQ